MYNIYDPAGGVCHFLYFYETVKSGARVLILGYGDWRAVRFSVPDSLPHPRLDILAVSKICHTLGIGPPCSMHATYPPIRMSSPVICDTVENALRGSLSRAGHSALESQVRHFRVGFLHDQAQSTYPKMRNKLSRESSFTSYHQTPHFAGPPRVQDLIHTRTSNYNTTQLPQPRVKFACHHRLV